MAGYTRAQALNKHLQESVPPVGPMFGDLYSRILESFFILPFCQLPFLGSDSGSGTFLELFRAVLLCSGSPGH